MKKLVPLIISIFLAFSGIAQDKTFTVMAVQGKVSVNGKALNIGQQLPADASVIVNESGYIGLLHKSGSPLEFKAKGTYNLKTYHDKLGSGKGFQQKYMDYVVNGMTKKADNGTYQKNMGITGSVDRALAKNEIVVPLPQKVVLLDDQIDLEWMDEGRVSEYKIVVMNMKEEAIMQLTTANKQIHMDLKGIELEPEQYYLVTVSDMKSSRHSNTVNFYIPSANEKAALSNDLEAIKSSLDMSTSVGMMAYAQICEEKKLFTEAFRAYRKARELSPDIDYFNTAYKEFVDDIVAQL